MNKHIYIFSPSGAVRDKLAFKRGVERLRAQGHQVEIDEAALKSHMRFAGDDDTRLEAIHRAAASGADLAMISRGGYGLTRILDRIRYPALGRAVARGLRFVGHSDFTALQLALLARTGAVSWAGPALTADFGGEEEPDDIMQACFDDLLLGQGEGTGWRLGRDDPMPTRRARAGEAAEPLQAWSVRDAVLWGGNLAVLSSMVGTPFLPDVRGGVLFVEDVNEHPYRVERMLTQLLHAGILGRQKALVLGQFSNYTLVPHDRNFRLATVVAWLRAQLKIPVFTQLPFGHVPTKVLLPVGAKVQFAVENREALLFWGHIVTGGTEHHHHGHPHDDHDHDHAH
ncbi:LD-carboxypeptidase [Pseudorhodoferax sp. Leaf267]|uniref:LD-carboxypeptidase n=1 Tax=Pseudorhodoferax sp. Leaf267 TaxID=1736316 RepID=UPI0009EC0576|nr:LD-carboxypeptidase [Pseudorhodoferax sp. Leaf267]